MEYLVGAVILIIVVIIIANVSGGKSSTSGSQNIKTLGEIGFGKTMLH